MGKREWKGLGGKRNGREKKGREGKVGRVASEIVVVELLIKKCLPVLFYGTDACPMSNAQTVVEFCSN